MATVNGLEAIIYDYRKDEKGAIWCDCFIPDAGWKIPVPASLIQVSDNR